MSGYIRKLRKQWSGLKKSEREVLKGFKPSKGLGPKIDAAMKTLDKLHVGVQSLSKEIKNLQADLRKLDGVPDGYKKKIKANWTTPSKDKSKVKVSRDKVEDCLNSLTRAIQAEALYCEYYIRSLDDIDTKMKAVRSK